MLCQLQKFRLASCTTKYDSLPISKMKNLKLRKVKGQIQDFTALQQEPRLESRSFDLSLSSFLYTTQPPVSLSLVFWTSRALGHAPIYINASLIVYIARPSLYSKTPNRKNLQCKEKLRMAYGSSLFENGSSFSDRTRICFSGLVCIRRGRGTKYRRSWPSRGYLSPKFALNSDFRLPSLANQSSCFLSHTISLSQFHFESGLIELRPLLCSKDAMRGRGRAPCVLLDLSAQQSRGWRWGRWRNLTEEFPFLKKSMTSLEDLVLV